MEKFWLSQKFEVGACASVGLELDWWKLKQSI